MKITCLGFGNSKKRILAAIHPGNENLISINEPADFRVSDDFDQFDLVIMGPISLGERRRIQNLIEDRRGGGYNEGRRAKRRHRAPKPLQIRKVETEEDLFKLLNELLGDSDLKSHLKPSKETSRRY